MVGKRVSFALNGATIEGKCICELSSIAEYVSCAQKKQEAQ